MLAFACAFTMFAGAAFTDSADIKVKSEVVDTLVELGVIQGYDDGSFRPNETVTRAQMAKMIYVLRTGNSDASAYNDDYTTFTDISTHWGRGYIKYCQSLGIIAGKSATIFAPDAKVTTQEAAKMLLVTLGYDAKKAGLVGTGWASKTNALADENGLLDDVNTSFTAACPRQYAAQLIYNTIDAPTVVWRDDAYHHTNVLDKDNQTVGEKYMSLKKTTSTLTKVTKTSGKDTYTITLDEKAIDWDNTTEDKPLTEFTEVKKDYSDLLYKTVTVLHKDRKTVYGVYATDDNTQQSGLLKNLKMDGSKAKLDGTKYDLADDTTVYINSDLLYKTEDGGFTTKSSEAKKDANDKKVTAAIDEWIDTYGDDATHKYENNQFWQGTEVELLATDGSTNFSILKVETAAIGKVTAVGSDYINVTVKGGDRTITDKTKLEEDDWNYPSDIAKDDYVVLTAPGNYADGDGRVEKAEVVSGKVTSTKSDDGVAIDDEWYTMAGKGSYMPKRPSTGSNVDLVVVNGYVYYSDTTAGSVEDVALLVEAAPSGGTGSKWEARMIFADGTDKVVDIEKYWEDKDGNSQIPEMKEATHTPILVTYEVSGDKYTLTKVGAKHTYDNDDYETAGYDVYASAASLKTDGSLKNADNKIKLEWQELENNKLVVKNTTIDRLYYENTGVVFVEYKTKANGESDYKVVTGKTAQDYDKDVLNMAAVADKSGSGYYAQAAYINLGATSTGGSSDNYAVVLDDVVKDTSNGTVYKIKAWSAQGDVTIITDDGAAKGLSKGDLFTWTGSTDDADIDTCGAQGNFYVTAYDEGSGDISLVAEDKTTSAKNWFISKYVGEDKKYDKPLDDDGYSVVDSSDSVVLFVNSDDGMGVESGEIELAYWFDDDFYTKADRSDLTEDDAPNVHCYFDDDDYITVIVVDVNRNYTEW